MKHSNQSGFAVIETVLMLVIVGILGFTSWFVWYAKQSTDTSLANTAKSQPATSLKKQADASTNSKVDLNAPIVTTKYSKVPAELQQAIFDYTKQHAPGCIKGDMIVDFNGQANDQTVIYWSAGWAETTVGCDGGAGTVFAQNASGWEEIAATQDRFNCQQLESHMTPGKFLIAISPNQSTQCIDNNGTERTLEG